MDEKLMEKLVCAGIDVDDAMERLAGHYFLLEKFLKRFPEDENYNKLCKCMDEGNIDSAFRASHTLKGVCFNMSMNDLGKLVNEVVEALRVGDLKNAKNQMIYVSESYKKMVADIKDIYNL